MHHAHEIAQSLAARGWHLVRIGSMSKAPLRKDWPKVPAQPHEFLPGDNLGVALGAASGGLVDVDLDCIEAVQLAPAFLPLTATFGRPSKERSHWVYMAPGVPKTTRLKQAHVELRSTGGQTVFPPSIHESGEPITWTPDNSPITQVTPSELRAAFCRLACGVLLARALPHLSGGVHDMCGALAGALRREGWPVEDVLDLVERSIGLEPEHRAHYIRDTYAKDEDDRTTGWPTLERLITPVIAREFQVMATDDALGYKRQTVIELASEPPFNDSGNADRLVHRFAQDLRYADGMGWLRWTGTRWEETDAPWAEAESIARELERTPGDGEAAKRLRQHGLAMGKIGQLRAMMEVASHRPEIRAEASDFDSDPWLLGVTNGTLDLRTGQLREARREDLITRSAGVAYDPDATAPRFYRFLHEVMGDDPELVSYLLRFLGYSLTGNVSEHVFGLWHGPDGRNGKGTLIRLLLQVFGDYAGTVPPDVLLMSSGSQHPTGLMSFRGRRLMLSNEAPEGRRWDEALIKTLTGGDTISARAMRQDFVEFTPTHHLVLAANTRPLVREQGPAFWSRVHLVPWLVSFRGREDPNLDADLAAEASGVLRALVWGCGQWLAHGQKTRPPRSMLEAGSEYRSSQDTMGMFVDEALVDDRFAPDGTPNPKASKAPRTHVYEAYKRWAEVAGEDRYRLTRAQFYRVMEERGYEQTKDNGTRVFKGLRVRTSVESIRAVS